MANKYFPYDQFEDYLEVLLAQNKIDNWEILTAGCYLINGEIEVYPKNNKAKIFYFSRPITGENINYNEIVTYKHLIDLL